MRSVRRRQLAAQGTPITSPTATQCRVMNIFKLYDPPSNPLVDPLGSVPKGEPAQRPGGCNCRCRCRQRAQAQQRPR